MNKIVNTGSTQVSVDKTGVLLIQEPETEYKLGVQGEQIANIVDSGIQNVIFYTAKQDNEWVLGSLNLVSGQHQSFKTGLSANTTISSISVTPNQQLIVNTLNGSASVVTYDMSTGQKIQNSDADTISSFVILKNGQSVVTTNESYQIIGLYYAVDGSVYLHGKSKNDERLFAKTYDGDGRSIVVAITDGLQAGQIKSVFPVSATNCFFGIGANDFKSLYEYNLIGGVNSSGKSLQYSKVDFSNSLYQQSGRIDAAKLTSFYGYNLESVSRDNVLSYFRNLSDNRYQIISSSPESLNIDKAAQVNPGGALESVIARQICDLGTFLVEANTFAEKVNLKVYDKSTGRLLNSTTHPASSNNSFVTATVNGDQDLINCYLTETGKIGLIVYKVSETGLLDAVFEGELDEAILEHVNDYQSNQPLSRASSRLVASYEDGSLTIRSNANTYRVNSSLISELLHQYASELAGESYLESYNPNGKIYSYPTYQVTTQSPLNGLDYKSNKFNLPKGSLLWVLPSKTQVPNVSALKKLNDVFKKADAELTIFGAATNTYDTYSLDPTRKDRAITASVGGELVKKFKWGAEKFKKGFDWRSATSIGDEIFYKPDSTAKPYENSLGVYGEYNNKAKYDISSQSFNFGQEGMKAGLKGQVKGLVYGYPDAGLFASLGIKVGYVGSNSLPSKEQAQALNNIFSVKLVDGNNKPITSSTPETDIYYTLDPFAWVPAPAQAAIGTVSDVVSKAYEIYQWFPPALVLTLLQKSQIPGADAVKNQLEAVYTSNGISVSRKKRSRQADVLLSQTDDLTALFKNVSSSENLDWFDTNGMEIELIPGLSAEGMLGPFFARVGLNAKLGFDLNFTKEQYNWRASAGADALFEFYFGIRLRAEFDFPIYSSAESPLRADTLAYNTYAADRFDTLQDIIIEPYNTSLTGVYRLQNVASLNDSEESLLEARTDTLIPIDLVRSTSNPNEWSGLFVSSTIDGDNQTGILQDLFLLSGSSVTGTVKWDLSTYKHLATGFVGNAQFSSRDADTSLVTYRGVYTDSKNYSQVFDATKVRSGDFGLISVGTQGLLKTPALRPVKYISADDYIFADNPARSASIFNSAFNASTYGSSGAQAKVGAKTFFLAGAPNSGLQNGKVTFIGNQAILDAVNSKVNAKKDSLDLSREFSTSQYRQIYLNSDNNTSTRFGASVSTTGSNLLGYKQASSLILNPEGLHQNQPVAFLIDNRDIEQSRSSDIFLYGSKSQINGVKFTDINNPLLSEEPKRYYQASQITGLSQFPGPTAITNKYSAISYIPASDESALDYINTLPSKSFVQIDNYDPVANSHKTIILDFDNLLRGYGVDDIGISGSITALPGRLSDSLVVGAPGTAFLIPEFDSTLKTGSQDQTSGDVHIFAPTDIQSDTPLYTFAAEANHETSYLIGLDKDRNGIIDSAEIVNAYQISDTGEGQQFDFIDPNEFSNWSFKVSDGVVTDESSQVVGSMNASQAVLDSKIPYLPFVYAGSYSPLTVSGASDYLALSTDSSDGKGTTYLVKNDTTLFASLISKEGSYYLNTKPLDFRSDKDYLFTNGKDGYAFANSGNASLFTAENGIDYIAVARLPQPGVSPAEGSLYLLNKKELDASLKKNPTQLIDPRSYYSSKHGDFQVANANSQFGDSITVIKDDSGAAHLLVGSPYQPDVKSITDVASTDQDAYFAKLNGIVSKLTGSASGKGALIIASTKYKNDYYVVYTVPVQKRINGLTYSVNGLYVVSTKAPGKPTLLVDTGANIDATFNNVVFKPFGDLLRLEVIATSAVTQQAFTLQSDLNADVWSTPKVISTAESLADQLAGTPLAPNSQALSFEQAFTDDRDSIAFNIHNLSSLPLASQLRISFLDRTAFQGQHYSAQSTTITCNDIAENGELRVPFTRLDFGAEDLGSRSVDTVIDVLDRDGNTLQTLDQTLYLSASRQELDMKVIGLGSRVTSSRGFQTGISSCPLDSQQAAFLQTSVEGNGSYLGIQRYTGRDISFGTPETLTKYRFAVSPKDAGNIALDPNGNLIVFTVANVKYIAASALAAGKSGSVVVMPYNDAILNNKTGQISASDCIVLFGGGSPGFGGSLLFDSAKQYLYIGDEDRDQVFGLAGADLASLPRASQQALDLSGPSIPIKVSTIAGPRDSGFGHALYVDQINGEPSLLVGAPGDQPSATSPVPGSAAGGSITIIKSNLIGPSGLDVSTDASLQKYVNAVTRIRGMSYTVDDPKITNNQQSYGQALGASIVTANILSDKGANRDLIIGAPRARYQDTLATPGGIYILDGSNAFFGKSLWTLGSIDNAANLGGQNGLKGTILYGQENNGLTGTAILNVGGFTGSPVRDTLAIALPSSQYNLGSVVFYQGNNALPTGKDSAFSFLRPLSESDHAFQILGAGSSESPLAGSPANNYLGSTISSLGNFSGGTSKNDVLIGIPGLVDSDLVNSAVAIYGKNYLRPGDAIAQGDISGGLGESLSYNGNFYAARDINLDGYSDYVVADPSRNVLSIVYGASEGSISSPDPSLFDPKYSPVTSPAANLYYPTVSGTVFNTDLYARGVSKDSPQFYLYNGTSDFLRLVSSPSIADSGQRDVYNQSNLPSASNHYYSNAAYLLTNDRYGINLVTWDYNSAGDLSLSTKEASFKLASTSPGGKIKYIDQIASSYGSSFDYDMAPLVARQDGTSVKLSIEKLLFKKTGETYNSQVSRDLLSIDGASVDKVYAFYQIRKVADGTAELYLFAKVLNGAKSYVQADVFSIGLSSYVSQNLNNTFRSQFFDENQLRDLPMSSIGSLTGDFNGDGLGDYVFLGGFSSGYNYSLVYGKRGYATSQRTMAIKPLSASRPYQIVGVDNFLGSGLSDVVMTPVGGASADPADTTSFILYGDTDYLSDDTPRMIGTYGSDVMKLEKMPAYSTMVLDSLQGDDSVSVASLSSAYVNLGAGDDTLNVSLAGASDRTLANMRVNGSTGFDRLVLSGSSSELISFKPAEIANIEMIDITSLPTRLESLPLNQRGQALYVTGQLDTPVQLPSGFTAKDEYVTLEGAQFQLYKNSGDYLGSSIYVNTSLKIAGAKAGMSPSLSVAAALASEQASPIPVSPQASPDVLSAYSFNPVEVSGSAPLDSLVDFPPNGSGQAVSDVVVSGGDLAFEGPAPLGWALLGSVSDPSVSPAPGMSSDLASPSLEAITLHGRDLKLQFDEVINPGSIKPSRFRVRVDGQRLKVLDASVADDSSFVLLSLPEVVEMSSQVSVGYRAPSGLNKTGVLEDLWGNDVPSFVNMGAEIL